MAYVHITHHIHGTHHAPITIASITLQWYYIYDQVKHNICFAYCLLHAIYVAWHVHIMIKSILLAIHIHNTHGHFIPHKSHFILHHVQINMAHVHADVTYMYTQTICVHNHTTRPCLCHTHVNFHTTFMFTVMAPIWSHSYHTCSCYLLLCSIHVHAMCLYDTLSIFYTILQGP